MYQSTQAQVGSVYWDVLHDRSSARDEAKEHTTPDTGMWVIGVSCKSHTAERGWCLQERLLSNRSLVFTVDTVQLRCHTETRNIDRTEHSGNWDLSRLPDAIVRPNTEVVLGSAEWKAIHDSWWNIVIDYSRRSLSKRTDRLVAISGLAAMFASALGPGYHAGLWRYSLLRDLLWGPQTGCECRLQRWPRPREYVAPSWSWASYDAPIEGDQCGSEDTIVHLARVMACITPLEDDKLPFGQAVPGGSLLLYASTLRCTWAGLHEDDMYEHRDIAVETATLPFALDPGDRLRDNFYGIDCEEDGDLQDIWFVPLIGERVERGEDGNGMSIKLNGLIITRADSDYWPGGDPESRRRGEVYRRVGFCAFRPLSLRALRGMSQLQKEMIELV
ncbi:hypothetical protein ONZ51_g1683 [Trametes cubensis]|uniref:Heterokaryon incompatibility domain-containing protein n=1 Tax=Trametes cubensis TaxID=1111947 RepID=A0AAD7U122_9APHY|nr:hypothetical protein ONZ51_g1683 [Trametes cubensis]